MPSPSRRMAGGEQLTADRSQTVTLAPKPTSLRHYLLLDRILLYVLPVGRQLVAVRDRADALTRCALRGQRRCSFSLCLAIASPTPFHVQFALACGLLANLIS